MRDQAVERPAVKGDAAGLVPQRAAQAVDEGALARAVRPDQPDPLAGGDREIDAFERDKAAEALAEAVDREQWPAAVPRGHGRVMAGSRRPLRLLPRRADRQCAAP